MPEESKHLKDQLEHLRAANEHLDAYKRNSLCTYCRQYVDVEIDTNNALGETEAIVAQHIQSRLSHEKMPLLPSINKDVRGMRDMAKQDAVFDSLLDRGKRPAAKAAPDKTRPSGLGLMDMVKDTTGGVREGIGSLIPHPLGILGPKNGRPENGAQEPIGILPRPFRSRNGQAPAAQETAAEEGSKNARRGIVPRPFGFLGRKNGGQ